MRSTLVVYGDGPRFRRRFGRALAVAELNPVPSSEQVEQPADRQDIFVASWLDGQPRSLPSAREHGIRGVLVGPPASVASERPEPSLERDVSPETLMFHLGGLIHSERSFERVLVSLPAVYGKFDDETENLHRSQTVSLSLGGCFVRSLEPPPAGAPVVVILTSHDGQRQAQLTGRVVYRILARGELGVIMSESAPSRVTPCYPGFAVSFDPLDELSVNWLESELLVAQAGGAELERH